MSPDPVAPEIRCDKDEEPMYAASFSAAGKTLSVIVLKPPTFRLYPILIAILYTSIPIAIAYDMIRPKIWPCAFVLGMNCIPPHMI